MAETAVRPGIADEDKDDDIAAIAKGGNFVTGSIVRKLSCESACNNCRITVSMHKPSFNAITRGKWTYTIPYCFMAVVAPGYSRHIFTIIPTL